MTKSRATPASEENALAAPSLPNQTLFPFTNLPPELRVIIWCLYCPDLQKKGRVLHFVLSNDEKTIRGDTALWSETQRLRSVMAVHTESRQLDKHAFPKELHFGNKDKPSVVRIKPEWDLIYAPITRDPIDGLQEVENVCIGQSYRRILQSSPKYLEGLPNLQRVFVFHPLLKPPQDRMPNWLSSNRVMAHRYGGYYKRNHICIWPNAIDYPRFAKLLAAAAKLEWRPDGKVTYWPLFCTSTLHIDDIPVYEIRPADQGTRPIDLLRYLGTLEQSYWLDKVELAD